jgi:hypothetical protein
MPPPIQPLRTCWACVRARRSAAFGEGALRMREARSGRCGNFEAWKRCSVEGEEFQ